MRLKKTHSSFMTTLLAIFLLFATPALSQQPSPSKTQKLRNPLNDLLDEAQSAIDKNNFEAAIPPLQRFLAEKPDVAYAHFQLAYAFTALKRTAEARAEYERCIALDPKMSEAQLNLGVLLLDSDPHAAVKPLQSAVDLLPSQSRPRYLLGLAQERSGDSAAAEATLEGAVHLAPDDAEALANLAALYLRYGRPADAEAKFRRVLELQPQAVAALGGLAQSLDVQKKPEAAEAYRSYLQAQPNDSAARNRLVQLLIANKDYDAALTEINRAGEGHSPTIESLKLKADILFAQKKWDETITTLQQAIQLTPNDAALHAGLGRIYREKHDYPGAVREFVASLKLDNSQLAVLKDLGSTLYLDGKYQGTLTTLDAVAKRETPNRATWFLRALCYDKLQAVAPALDAYRKFLELETDPNSDQAWQAKQRIHVLEKANTKKK